VFEVPYIDGSYANAPSTLVSFNGANGADPLGDLHTDAAGDVFGTTEGGGANGAGTVFEIVGTPSTPGPMVRTLAEISSAAYDLFDSPLPIDGYTEFSSAGTNGFYAVAYKKGNQIVAAFRGTDFSVDPTTSYENVLADSSFGTGIPDPDGTFVGYLLQAMQFVADLSTDNAGADITLTGHSLGGAIAAMVGDLSGNRTVTFDAPGGDLLEAELQDEGVLPSASSDFGAENVVNYRLEYDQVSLLGIQIGQVFTIQNPSPLDFWNVVANHSIEIIINQLSAGVSGTSGIPDPPLLSATSVPLVAGLGVQAFQVIYDARTVGTQVLVDPPGAIQYQLVADAGAPRLLSFGLPVMRGVFAYDVSIENGSVWSPTEIIAPGTIISEASGFDGLQFSPLDGAGQPFALADSAIFSVGFASIGNFTGTLTTVPGASGNMFSWAASDGAFGNGANWMDVSSSTVGPPSNSDEADFVTGRGEISGSGSVEVLMFDGNNSWTVSAMLAVGSDVMIGASASSSTSVDITAGGSISSAGDAELATVATSSDTLSVTGPGQDFSVAGQLVDGEFGSARLFIENQATIQTGGHLPDELSEGLEIAQVFASTGDVTVAGDRSLLTNTGSFVVGDGGLGSLSIQSSGTVTTSAGAVIANTGGASGSSANVSGAGSQFDSTGSLIVGDAGFGSLSLSQAATVSAGGLDMGAATGGDGVVSVVGISTALNLTGDLTIGDQSSGELSILSGATVSAVNGNVGGAAGTGNVDIEGTGSALDLSGTLSIGLNAPAVFTLGENTELTLSGSVVTGANGVFNQEGTVDPANVVNDGQTNLGNGAKDEADVSIENSGIYALTNGIATMYTPLITFDPVSPRNNDSTQGLWQIGNQGTLVLNATTVDASQTVEFTKNNAVLEIGQVPTTNNGTITGTITPGSANVLAGFEAPIQNYKSGDRILFNGLSFGSDSVSGNTVTLWGGKSGTGTDLGSLSFITPSGGDDDVGAGLAAIQIETLACFATGTRIGTEGGFSRVEELKVGDRVATADGRCEAVVWVGSRMVDCTSHPQPELVWPVRISRGAFGAGIPMRDLFVSPDHAVFVDGVLVPVKLLANGTTIRQVERSTITYHHTELTAHEVILAEGLPVESYLDTGDRLDFDRGEEAIRLHPAIGRGNTATLWETKGSAPLVMGGERLNTLREKVVTNAQKVTSIHGPSRARRGSRANMIVSLG
jgi:collagen type I alpha